jgi:DNA repair protein RecO (recombination protein O)
MNNERLQDEAFVLHTYPYQETSLIVEAFTRHHGRIALIAKGARRPRSGMRGLIRQFQTLHLSWFGKSELRTLAAAEWVAAHIPLRGIALLCGFYLNELLLKLIAREDAHERLYDVYRALLPRLAADSRVEPRSTLPRLAADNRVEPLLRGFELALLRELGYALNLARTADTDEAVAPERHYGFSIERGPLAHGAGGDTVKFAGKTFLDMDNADYSDPVTSLQSKQLMRAAISHHLNGQPLHTRQLLRDLQAL